MSSCSIKKPCFDGIDAILIDLDQTLFNTREAKFANMRQIAEREGAGWSRELQAVFSRRQKELFELWLEENLTPQEFYYARGAAFCEVFSIPKTKEEGRAFVDASIRNSMELLPGVKEALASLSARNIPLYLASNGTHENQTGRLRQAGIFEYFTDCILPDHMGVPKPNEKFYRHALKVTGSTPERTLMIGDAVFDDIIGAKNVGIQTCWIMGSPDKKIPPEADYYVLGPADLI